MEIDEAALYGAATAALNARRAANGWPPTTLDKMLTPDREAWVEDVRAAITAYESAKSAEPVAWMWEEEVDPTGEVVVGKTIQRVAFHWSTPPKNAIVTPLYAHPKEAPDV